MSLARVRVPMYNRTGNCVVADDSARALACFDSDSRSAVPSCDTLCTLTVMRNSRFGMQCVE